MDGKQIIREMLLAIGENPDREGLRDTPKRVVKSWGELFAGYTQDPKEILSTRFEQGACDELVLLREIEFTSMCEHHMLPFRGVAHVGYLPTGKVVGLSKLARLVDCFARRLQIQEQLTMQIADTITEVLQPKGVGVVIEAHHQCMSCRGVGKQKTVMVTSAMRGVLRENQAARAEFLTLIRT